MCPTPGKLLSWKVNVHDCCQAATLNFKMTN
jgi:hypothetical protein